MARRQHNQLLWQTKIGALPGVVLCIILQFHVRPSIFVNIITLVKLWEPFDTVLPYSIIRGTIIYYDWHTLKYVCHVPLHIPLHIPLHVPVLDMFLIDSFFLL